MSAAFKKSVTLLTYTVEVPYHRVGTTISPQATLGNNMYGEHGGSSDPPRETPWRPPRWGNHIELGVRTKKGAVPKTKPPKPNPELPLSSCPY